MTLNCAPTRRCWRKAGLYEDFGIPYFVTTTILYHTYISFKGDKGNFVYIKKYIQVKKIAAEIIYYRI